MTSAESSTPEARVQAVKYTVNCMPDDFPDADMYAVTVEHYGNGLWAVHHRTKHLSADGTWSWGYSWEGGREPSTEAEMDAYNAGEDAWRAAHRFDEATALELAKVAARTVTVGRMTAEQALAEHLKEQ